MRAARVQTALADAWEVHGRLRAGVARLRGIRVMASGLAHPQYNSGDVSAPDADIDGARAFYARHGAGWGVRVPAGMPWRAGRHLLTLRLMGLDAAGFRPAREVAEVAVRAAGPADLAAVAQIDAVAFESTPEASSAWLAGHLGAARVTTAIAEAGGEPVGTGYALRSDGDAGPCLYLAGVAVLPSARGRGIGSLVTSWLLARGFAGGAGLAHLHPDTDAAARLYARFGFAEVDGLDVYVDL